MIKKCRIISKTYLDENKIIEWQFITDFVGQISDSIWSM
jgi:hypothetical protein